MKSFGNTRSHRITAVPRSRHSAVPYIAAIALSMSLGLGGCGHPEATAAKTTAGHRGKTDAAPWDNSRWDDNEGIWKRAISAREQNQNDYARIR
jgi:hypothetical protein